MSRLEICFIRRHPHKCNHHLQNMPWNLMFCTSLWCIWIFRNKLFHKAFSHQQIIDYTSFLANQIKVRSFKVVCFSNVKSSLHKRKMIYYYVKWNPPIENWFTLNTNCSIKGSPRPNGVGGLIRDNNRV